MRRSAADPCFSFLRLLYLLPMKGPYYYISFLCLLYHNPHAIRIPLCVGDKVRMCHLDIGHISLEELEFEAAENGCKGDIKLC